MVLFSGFALTGQLQPTVHTSYAKAYSYLPGCCQFCGLPSSATGSGRPRTPRAASGTRVQIHANLCTKKAPLKRMLFFWRSWRDLNPRAAHHGNTISNRARYDHFDTTPYYSKSAHRTDLDIITVFFAVVNTFLKNF